jgi:hypothetical protein
MSEWGLTTRVRAVVTLGSGALYPGYLHLLDGLHSGVPETPVEMLNRPGGFFPLTLDDGSVFLLAKAQVAQVAPEWPLEGAEPWQVHGRRIRLAVTMATGEELVGDVVVLGRAGHNRPLDYLNGTGPFFELELESGLRLLHAAWVSMVRPLE